MKQLLAIALALPLFGGGFHIELGAKDGQVLARFTGCHEPHKALLTATAEGLVGGKRQTIVLEPVAQSTPGLYSIPKKWPSEGKWVLKLVGRYPQTQAVTTTIVRLTNDGYDRSNIVMKPGEAPSSELDSLLR